MDSLANQFYQFVDTPWAPFLLSVHAMLESFFLPGAHDIFLIAVDVAKPKWCFIFACFSTLGSVIGGSLGYSVGRYGGRPLIERFFSGDIIDKVEIQFQRFGIWAVAIGGFTPLPYKLFALSAGIFEMHYAAFFLVSLLARAARFFTVSAILYWVGPQIKEYLVDYLNIFSIFLLGMGLAIYFIYTISRAKRLKQPPETL